MLTRFRRMTAAAMYGGTLPQDLTMDERRVLWPTTAELSAEHVRNRQVYPNRNLPLELIPPDAVCAEVGVFQCEYSTEILQAREAARTAPDRH